MFFIFIYIVNSLPKAFFGFEKSTDNHGDSINYGIPTFHIMYAVVNTESAKLLF